MCPLNVDLDFTRSSSTVHNNQHDVLKMAFLMVKMDSREIFKRLFWINLNAMKGHFTIFSISTFQTRLMSQLVWKIGAPVRQ